MSPSKAGFKVHAVSPKLQLRCVCVKVMVDKNCSMLLITIENNLDFSQFVNRNIN